MSILVLGGTGTLGRQIVRRALNEGFQVRCLVRNFRRAAFLKEWGAELIYGDLLLPETITVALYGITAIIDASTVRIDNFYNAKQIDLQAKYILIEAAKKAKIKHYIFFSIVNAHKYKKIPLINLKLLVENKLINSGICYTVFHLSGFFQGLIPQYAIPILDQKSIWVTNESKSIAYINTQDIAQIVIKSLSLSKSKNKIFVLFGNQSWTSMEIIKLCEKISGKRAKLSIIPIGFLKFLRQLTYYLQWTWNISDRLAFTEMLSQQDDIETSLKHTFDMLQIDKKDLESLDIYFGEYFLKIMNKLKELNYQTLDQNKNIVDHNF